MAKFNIFIMVALILASGVMASLAQESLNPSTQIDDTAFPPESEGELPPKLVPGYPKHLEHCAMKIEAECAKEIFIGMFKSLPVSEKCCLQLIKKMGKTCHDDLERAIIFMPEFSSRASEAIPKGEHIWDKCAVVAQKRVN